MKSPEQSEPVGQRVISDYPRYDELVPFALLQRSERSRAVKTE